MNIEIKGFTLIELLVTIVIIGIIATVSIAQYNNYITESKEAKIAAERAELCIKSVADCISLGQGGCQTYESCNSGILGEGLVASTKANILDANLQGCISTNLGKTWANVMDVDLGTIGNLSCSSQNISSISGVSAMPNLRYLVLTSNNLSELPAEIGLLTDLQRLDLKYNNIPGLPAEIGLMIGLRELYLNNIQLTSLPAEIGLLTDLVWINVTDNLNLTELPAEISLITGLKYLVLNHVGLTDVPASGAGIHLTRLYNYNNSQFTCADFANVGWVFDFCLE